MAKEMRKCLRQSVGVGKLCQVLKTLQSRRHEATDTEDFRDAVQAENYGLGVNVGVKVVGGKFWFVCHLDLGAFRPMIHFFRLFCCLVSCRADWLADLEWAVPMLPAPQLARWRECLMIDYSHSGSHSITSTRCRWFLSELAGTSWQRHITHDVHNFWKLGVWTFDAWQGHCSADLPSESHPPSPTLRFNQGSRRSRSVSFLLDFMRQN